LLPIEIDGFVENELRFAPALIVAHPYVRGNLCHEEYQLGVIMQSLPFL